MEQIEVQAKQPDLRRLAREYCDAAVAVEMAQRDGKPALALLQIAHQKRKVYEDAKLQTVQTN